MGNTPTDPRTVKKPQRERGQRSNADEEEGRDREGPTTDPTTTTFVDDEPYWDDEEEDLHGPGSIGSG
jgi:hypothetical protein